MRVFAVVTKPIELQIVGFAWQRRFALNFYTLAWWKK